MKIINTAPAWSHRRHWARRRRALVADLDSLSDRQLQDLGLWRGAIRDAAADLLARDGCAARNDIQR